MSRIEKAIEKATKLREAPTSAKKVAAEVVQESRFLTGAQGPKKEHEALLETAPLRVSDPMLVAAKNDYGAAAEEYRKLKSTVVRLTKGKEFRNTMLVTSTVGEEGKSMTALNLAMVLAQEYDYTVLLVDCDLRRPSVHRYLGLERDPGLVQCLQGDIDLSEALVKTGIGKLVILPAGGAVKNPTGLLSSNLMKDFIQEVKSRYPERYIIFDTPPSLPFAEAQVLAQEVDGVLFVVREGRAKVTDVKAALDNLRGSNLLGIVYNDAQFSSKKDHFYYY